MKNPCSNNKKKSECIIKTIALCITFAVVGVTIYIAIYSLYCGKENEFVKDIIGKTLIPLWGTWMGTVLAFYFGKDNFDAARKSYQDTIDKLTSNDEKLEKILVTDCMTKSGIRYSILEKIVEKTISEILTESTEGRFVIVDNNEVVKHVIHRSIFERFIALVALKGSEVYSKVEKEDNAADEDTDLTRKVSFNDFLNCTDPDISKFKGDKGFAVVSVHSNMLEAKKAMEANKCQDVIVTENGNRNEKVKGWITNNTIIEAAK